MDCLEYLRQRLAPREVVLDGVTWYFRPLNATNWIELQVLLAGCDQTKPETVAVFWRELLARTLCDAQGQPLPRELVEAVPYDVAQKLVDVVWPGTSKN